MGSGVVGHTEPQMGGDSGSGGEIGKVVILLRRVAPVGQTRIAGWSPTGGTDLRSVLTWSLPSVCTLGSTRASF